MLMIPITACVLLMYCGGNGDCVKDDSRGVEIFCKCHPGFTGATCSIGVVGVDMKMEDTSRPKQILASTEAGLLFPITSSYGVAESIPGEVNEKDSEPVERQIIEAVKPKESTNQPMLETVEKLLETVVKAETVEEAVVLGTGSGAGWIMLILSVVLLALIGTGLVVVYKKLTKPKAFMLIGTVTPRVSTVSDLNSGDIEYDSIYEEIDIEADVKRDSQNNLLPDYFSEDEYDFEDADALTAGTENGGVSEEAVENKESEEVLDASAFGKWTRGFMEVYADELDENFRVINAIRQARRE